MMGKKNIKPIKENLPLTTPDTADCAFSRVPISDARAPATTLSGPHWQAPARNKNIKLKESPHLEVT